MMNPFGAPPLMLPDFHEMRKNWRRATGTQKVARVGLAGGALYLLYVMVRRPDSRPRPAPFVPQSAPTERPTPVERADLLTGRGHYR